MDVVDAFEVAIVTTKPSMTHMDLEPPVGLANVVIPTIWDNIAHLQDNAWQLPASPSAPTGSLAYKTVCNSHAHRRTWPQLTFWFFQLATSGVSWEIYTSARNNAKGTSSRHLGSRSRKWDSRLCDLRVWRKIYQNGNTTRSSILQKSHPNVRTLFTLCHIIPIANRLCIL